jgi:acyl phosphate:glycerol-3-phosphate acyltransferase
MSSSFWPTIILGIASYAVGGIPTAYLMAKKSGLDLRNKGSGNLGATNTSRILGMGTGSIVALLDIVKGVVPVLFSMLVFSLPLGSHLIIGTATILGHVFTPYLRPHKGGKGVATGAGVIAVLFPYAIPLGLMVFFAIAIVTKYVSLASMITFLALIPYYWIMSLVTDMEYESVRLVFLIVLSIIIIYAHRENLRRLLRHEEPKFKALGKKESP